MSAAIEQGVSFHGDQRLYEFVHCCQWSEHVMLTSIYMIKHYQLAFFIYSFRHIRCLTTYIIIRYVTVMFAKLSFNRPVTVPES
jgi:hypothetical protein